MRKELKLKEVSKVPEEKKWAPREEEKVDDMKIPVKMLSFVPDD